MDFYDIIKKRKSIRHYKDEPLPNGALERILDAGRMANSARNRQEWAFIVVTDEKIKEVLVPACRDQKFLAEAAVVIVGCATDKLKMTCGQPADVIDISIALDHMQLAAAAENLGTCWLGSYYQNQIKDILKIPPEVSVIGILTIGVPAEEGRPKSRKPLGEIIHFEKW